jgi:acyl carrier protein phosphodiesterase
VNWLAHIYLSEPDAAFRIGNLLPDILPYSQLTGLSADFQRGIRRHRRIDAFTDAHPVVKQSIRRIEPPFRRYGGVLVDVFYDHILAREWPAYSEQPLSKFVGDVYRSFESLEHRLPPQVWQRLESMRHSDLLGSYRELSGIAAALDRIASRLRRHIPLADATAILDKNYAAFRTDFEIFFPDLRAHVEDSGV